jgi:predicted nucleic acid-binding Zn ribbon protein
MEPIGRALERFLRSSALERRVADFQVVAAWAETVGPETAAQSEAFELRRGVLWISVTSSVWSQHIGFLKPRILEALRRRFPEVKLVDVKCVMRGQGALHRGDDGGHR